MKRNNLQIVWGYAVEPLLAILLVGLACSTIGSTHLANLVRQFATDLATLYCAVFFAAALGFLWTFYSKADTEFYTWLDEINSFGVYLHATAYVVAIEGGAIFALLATKIFTSDTYALIAAFIFFMAVINSYTLVVNVIGIMRLHTLYNRVSKKNGLPQP